MIDFEGEPGRSLTERRRRTFALKDVAGMLRSFAYAADASGSSQRCRHGRVGGIVPVGLPRGLACDSRPTAVAIQRARDLDRLLALYELQKLVYELRYELANRPDWVGIPVSGLERMLEGA